MANYLNIANDNGKLIISDTLNIMQPVRSIKGVINSFTANSVDSTYGPRAFSPYTGVSTETLNSIHADYEKALMAYRIVGDVGDLPYGRVYLSEYDYEKNIFKLGCNSFGNTPIEVQTAFLAYNGLKKPFGKCGMLAFNEQEKLIFDASLGTVHHLGSIYTKLNVGSDGDKNYLIKDLTGLGLDPARIFISLRATPYVSFVEYRDGGNQYRSGWRTWMPRYRVTDNKLFLDLKRWVPKNYTGYYDSEYQPIFAASLYYLPNIRL